MPEHTEIAPPAWLSSAFTGVLPHRGQDVRMMLGGDVVSATVAWTDDWTVHVVANVEPDPGPDPKVFDPRVRLIWRGETHAICIDGLAAPGRTEWTVVCDPTTVSTLEERVARRVNVRAPVDITVPTRLAPEVQKTWTINLSESGVALEPPQGLLISTGEPLVLRMGFDATPVITVGRVVAAGASEPVRVEFARMSPTVRSQLIGVVNRLEAASKAHTR